MIDLVDVRELHVDLRRMLDQELTAGNVVIETWRGWPKATTVCVRLERPFATATLAELGGDLVYEAVNDPHYWYEEILHRPTGHLLVR